MRFKKTKRFIQLFSFILLTTWCYASGVDVNDGHSNIQVKEKKVQDMPRGSSIQASIDGHVLTVVFLENLGQVSIEISRVPTGETQMQSTPTPDGVEFYIFSTGNFIVTFTLPNGDEYYGEFSVTD